MSGRRPPRWELHGQTRSQRMLDQNSEEAETPTHVLQRSDVGNEGHVDHVMDDEEQEVEEEEEMAGRFISIYHATHD